jgi:hypothetical protein
VPGAFAVGSCESFPFDAARTGISGMAQAKERIAPHSLRAEFVFDITLRPLL